MHYVQAVVVSLNIHQSHLILEPKKKLFGSYACINQNMNIHMELCIIWGMKSEFHKTIQTKKLITASQIRSTWQLRYRRQYITHYMHTVVFAVIGLLSEWAKMSSWRVDEPINAVNKYWAQCKSSGPWYSGRECLDGALLTAPVSRKQQMPIQTLIALSVMDMTIVSC